MKYYSLVTQENQADYYEAIRLALGPGYESISDIEADRIAGRLLSQMSPEEQEGFLSSLGRIAKSAGRTVVKALPTVAPIAGSLIGTAFGGPAGTAIGGAIGNMVGGLATRGTPPTTGQAPRRPPVPTHAPPIPRRIPPSTAAPQSRPQIAPNPGATSLGSGAAAQLLSLIQNPQLLNSLLGQLLNAREAVDIEVKGEAVQVPFSAFMNTLAYLAEEAALEARPTAAGSVPEYLMDAEGQYLVDPSSDQERVSILLTQLADDSASRYHRLAKVRVQKPSRLSRREYEYFEEEIEDFSPYDPLTEWFLERGMIER